MDNRKLAEGIRSQEVNLKDYKKKLATEVGEYIKLREHIQRFKTIRENNSPSARTNSQTRIMKTERIERSENGD